MTFFKKDCASFDHIAPLYVKGILSDEQRLEFEKAVAECINLKDTIEEWKLLNNAYQALECSLPEPQKNLYPKIAEKVRASKRQSLFQKLMPSPPLSLAFIAVQLLIIITLGVYILQLKTEYRTLSAPVISGKNTVKINVVFKEDATESEVRKLLLQVDGRIINGPCSSGLYVIEIPSKKPLEGILKTFKKSRIVVLAERAY